MLLWVFWDLFEGVFEGVTVGVLFGLMFVVNVIRFVVLGVAFWCGLLGLFVVWLFVFLLVFVVFGWFC